MTALFRSLYGFIGDSAKSLKQTPLLGLPIAGVPLSKSPQYHSVVTLPRPFWPPVVQWTEPRELIAWRAWRLLQVECPRGVETSGLRLISLSAPCIWNGPVARVNPPDPDLPSTSGIYSLKPDVAERNRWQFSEDCWVTGTIALSGRVIEHHLGYRAERVVIRSLRLAVGTHLVVRDLRELQHVIKSLETRYQVAVDVGQAEREEADRMRTRGVRPETDRPNWTTLKEPWQLI
jgi:hypothetical protein